MQKEKQHIDINNRFNALDTTIEMAEEPIIEETALQETVNVGAMVINNQPISNKINEQEDNNKQ